jgi:hypothetical protein
VAAGSTGNDGSGGAGGSVATLLLLSAPEVDVVWPGAAPECPELVEVLAE